MYSMHVSMHSNATRFSQDLTSDWKLNWHLDVNYLQTSKCSVSIADWLLHPIVPRLPRFAFKCLLSRNQRWNFIPQNAVFHRSQCWCHNGRLNTLIHEACRHLEFLLHFPRLRLGSEWNSRWREAPWINISSRILMLKISR